MEMYVRLSDAAASSDCSRLKIFRFKRFRKLLPTFLVLRVKLDLYFMGQFHRGVSFLHPKK